MQAAKTRPYQRRRNLEELRHANARSFDHCRGFALPGLPALAAEPAASWPAVTLAPAGEVTLSGPLGEALQHGVARLAKPPYTEPWLRADVSFELNRIFTNYSGDVSGRFLELASLTSPPGRFSPPTLAPLLKTVAGFQKPDGHFGAAVDLDQAAAEELAADSHALGQCPLAGRPGDRGPAIPRRGTAGLRPAAGRFLRATRPTSCARPLARPTIAPAAPTATVTPAAIFRPSRAWRCSTARPRMTAI